MKGYDLTINRKMKIFNGKIFMAEDKLYFLPTGNENIWKTGVAKGIGGAVGKLVAGKSYSNTYELLNDDLEEDILIELAESVPDARVFEANKFTLLRNDIWMRCFKYDNMHFGMPKGFPKDMKSELSSWAKKHNLKTKGKYFK